MVMLFVSPSIGELLHLLPDVGKATVSLSHVSEMFGALNHVPARQSHPPAHSSFHSVELRAIRHDYTANGKDAFRVGPLNFTLKAGEIVFVVGGNGSGKTTFAMLLLGLYKSQSGSILLNGREIEEASIDQYRSCYSAIFSDYELLNTLFDHSVERVQETDRLLEKLCLRDKVSVIEGRFSSTALSSGQRKRLALVSAYLEDRPIYVFDEWAADQDPEFRRFFYSDLLPELKKAGKGVVAITHDDQYFQYADRVLQMRNGHLSEWHPHT
jgi:putative pyoverdin transport system ATP-binding/permease protein